MVQAVREQIVAHLRAALRAEPLAPRPDPVVVQGPMTQVSDRSAFAGAVAQEGGLPFLALGSMDGGQARALLGETADRLGDRPWGAAILSGPPDLREEQLAAVSAARPPYAIIGAGRPAEAASLEDAGISAYLHVPSRNCSAASSTRARGSSSSQAGRAAAPPDRAQASRSGTRRSNG